MPLLDDILAANSAVLERSDVPVPAVPPNRRVVVVTCSEIHAPFGRDLSVLFGLGSGGVFVVANSGARVHERDGDIVRSVAVALADAGGGEVFVVAHEDCRFLEADSDALGALLAAGGSQALVAAESFCGEDFVSARKLAMASAAVLRASYFLPKGTPVHALLMNDSRGALSCEERGYGLIVAAVVGRGVVVVPRRAVADPRRARASGFGPSGFGAAGPVALFGSAPSSLMGAAPPPSFSPSPVMGTGGADFSASRSPDFPSPPAPPPPAPPGPGLDITLPPPLEKLFLPPERAAGGQAADDPFQKASERLARLRRERRRK